MGTKSTHAGKYSNWDKSSPRYTATTAKAVEIAWVTLNAGEAGAQTIAELERELLMDGTSEQDRQGMAEMADDIIRNLHRFKRRIASDTARCERCGTSFIAMRSDARYCSTACRVAAHRARRSPGAPSPPARESA